MADDTPVGALPVVVKLDELIKAVNELHNRDEIPAPGAFVIPFVAKHERMRVVSWVVSVDAAGTYALQLGTSVRFTVQTAAADTLVIPLPITIDRGTDVSIVATGGNVTDSLLVAYTE